MILATVLYGLPSPLYRWRDWGPERQVLCSRSWDWKQQSQGYKVCTLSPTPSYLQAETTRAQLITLLLSTTLRSGWWVVICKQDVCKVVRTERGKAGRAWLHPQQECRMGNSLTGWLVKVPPLLWPHYVCGMEKPPWNQPEPTLGHCDVHLQVSHIPFYIQCSLRPSQHSNPPDEVGRTSIILKGNTLLI